MSLYLDTEFNGFGGELISLALVSSHSNKEWYEVLPLPHSVHPWVAKNVVPFLLKPAIEYNQFVASLHRFLLSHPDEEVYADWPEDIAHFSRLLCGEGGHQLNYWPVLRLINSGPLSSAIPHNALEDARALMRWNMLG